MSVSYTGDPYRHEPISPYTPRDDLRTIDSRRPERVERSTDEPFVPVYARRGKAVPRGGQIKTWMILAPVGVLVLGGAAAAMLMSGGENRAAPLVEPSAAATALPTTSALNATQTAPLPATAPPVEATPEPVARRADPAPVRRAAAAPAPARRAITATAPARMQTAPAAAATSPTVTLNTAPTTAEPTTPVPTLPVPDQPPAPAIVVQPLG